MEVAHDDRQVYRTKHHRSDGHRAVAHTDRARAVVAHDLRQRWPRASRTHTDSQGSTTIYDASGKVTGRTSTSGNTTTIYDAVWSQDRHHHDAAEAGEAMTHTDTTAAVTRLADQLRASRAAALANPNTPPWKRSCLRRRRGQPCPMTCHSRSRSARARSAFLTMSHPTPCCGSKPPQHLASPMAQCRSPRSGAKHSGPSDDLRRCRQTLHHAQQHSGVEKYMPRPSKGPRLALYKAKGRTTVWNIRDGQRTIGTGCVEGDRATAEKKLAAYITRQA